jgi:GH25 family lysozyme M1 (1,4-beta-N-acetylmuramidase)
MSEVFGIDVSHYQGKIEWKKVADSGKKFCVMKCQYEAQSHRLDETFEDNYRGCGIYGLSRGVYIYIARCSIADPVKDAKALLAHLNDRSLEYGIWLDFEDESLRRQGKAKIRDLAYLYAGKFRTAGYHVGIYCNKDWYDNLIHPDLKRDFDFWIARYPKADVGAYYHSSKLKPNYQQAVAWQYSSKGTVPGINGAVDLDVDFDGVVNLICTAPTRKTNEEIAREVLEDKWGTAKTNPTRSQLLTRAGYDPKAIQKIVNQLKRGN